MKTLLPLNFAMLVCFTACSAGEYPQMLPLTSTSPLIFDAHTDTISTIFTHCEYDAGSDTTVCLLEQSHNISGVLTQQTNQEVFDTINDITIGPKVIITSRQH